MSLNVKFSSGYKIYAKNIPAYLKNRPRSLVIFLLEITLMIDSGRGQADESFKFAPMILV